MSFPAKVSISIGAVNSKGNYNRHSPSRTCGRCGLKHNSSSHCPAPVTADVPTTGSTCTAPTPHQGLLPEEETTDQGTDAITGLTVAEEGTNTRKVSKLKPQHEQNSHHKQSSLKTTHRIPEDFVVQEFREIRYQDFSKAAPQKTLNFTQTLTNMVA